jgi:hypothetical protein
VLEHPVLAVRAEEGDAVVDGDAAFEIETWCEAVADQRGDADVAVAAMAAEEQHRIRTELEVALVDRFGGFHDAEVLRRRRGSRDNQQTREQ